MKKGDKAGIVCCSNGLAQTKKEQLKKLETVLQGIGLIPVRGEFIFERDSVFSGTAQERAESLMNFYRDPDIKAVFDISGGDIGNEILPYLDFEVISASEKQFWGYSDLTTVINAIYAKTGKSSVLYQVRNLVGTDGERQIQNFRKSIMDRNAITDNRFRESSGYLPDKTDHLFAINVQMIQGKEMEGILAGGNIRCLLKLAGTPYWPDMNGKILLLEAWHGKLPQMTTFLSQLKQMGVFEQVNGILLGTFTQMEEEQCVPTMEQLVLQYAGTDLPVAKTYDIGHGKDSKAAVIGQRIQINEM